MGTSDTGTGPPWIPLERIIAQLAAIKGARKFGWTREGLSKFPPDAIRDWARQAGIRVAPPPLPRR